MLLVGSPDFQEFKQYVITRALSSPGFVDYTVGMDPRHIDYYNERRRLIQQGMMESLDLVQKDLAEVELAIQTMGVEEQQEEGKDKLFGRFKNLKH
jgi:hypothetical protein